MNADPRTASAASTKRVSGRKLTAASLALAAGLGLTGLAMADSASASSLGTAASLPNCVSWNDGVTYGVHCNAGWRYHASAVCRNGKYVTGRSVWGTATSYAYCSSVGSTLDHGWPTYEG